MTWEEREELAANRYQAQSGSLHWDDARPAAKDAYDRLAAQQAEVKQATKPR